MIYYWLKILHIISATLMLTSIIYCYRLWKNIRHSNETTAISQRIQTQTWSFIIPFALIQLATGFTMISIQHYDFSEWWISGSVIGFIVVMGSWLSFIYFLLMSQQQLIFPNSSLSSFGKTEQKGVYRHAQAFMLILCAAALLSIIFFMANKSAAIYVNHP